MPGKVTNPAEVREVFGEVMRPLLARGTASHESRVEEKFQPSYGIDKAAFISVGK